MINTNQAREAAMISAASYNYNEPANKQSPLPAGYKLTVNPNKNDEVLVIDDPKTGFHAEIYQKIGTNEYTVAFTGTQPETGTDELADLAVGVNQWNPENKQRVFDALASLKPSKVTFTGHSLGGMLSQYAIYDYLYDNKNATASLITFNAAGGMEGLQTLHKQDGVDMSIANRIDGAVFTGISSGRQDLVSRVGGAHFGGISYDIDLGANLDVAALHTPWNFNATKNFFDLTIPSTSTPIQSVNLVSARKIAAAVAFLLDDGDNSNRVEAFSRSASGVLLGLATASNTELNQIGDLLGTYLGKDNPIASAYNNLLGAYDSPTDSWSRIALALAGIMALGFSLGTQVGDIAVFMERKATQILDDAAKQATGAASTILQKAYSKSHEVLVDLISNHSNSTADKQNPVILDNKVDPVNLNPSAPQPGDTTHNEATGAAGAGWRSDASQEFINQGGLNHTALGNIVANGVRPGNGSVANTQNIINTIRTQQFQQNQSQAQNIHLPDQNVKVEVIDNPNILTGKTFTVYKEDPVTHVRTDVSIYHGSYRKDHNDRILGIDTTDGKYFIEFTSAPTKNSDGTITINRWAKIEKEPVVNQLQTQAVATKDDHTDPLTLDSGNNGISFSATPVNFDYDANGVAEALSWTAPTDPLLVLDKNGDGRINNGTELVDLIGEAAPIGLFDLDSNQDKKLNINDSAFSLLQIWSDRNQDGYASAQELKTLSSLGIVSIDLDPAHIQTTALNGKIIRGVTATYQDGSTKVLWDVPFAPAGSSNNPVSVTRYSADIDKVSSSGQVALQAMSSLGVNLNLANSGATQAIGSTGNDTLTGTDADEWLIGGAGADKFSAGNGADLLVIDADDNLQDIDAGAGIDTVIIADDRGVFLNLAQTKTEVVYGGYGDDVLVGGGSDNYFIDGADGDDLIVGGNADDVLSGADGEDVIQGGKGDDLIRGGRDNDQLFGGEDNDVLDGGLGNDIVKGESGNDVIIASGGMDTLDGGSGTDLLQLSGALEDYIFEYQYKDGYIPKHGGWVKKPSWVIKDTKNLDGSRVDFSKGEISDRNGIQTLKDVEKFSYMRGNTSTVMNLDGDNPLPVNDLIQGVNTSQPIRVKASTLLANDIDFGKINNSDFPVTKVINWVGDAVGGSVAIDAGSGDIVFTPNAEFRGVMEFTYRMYDWVGFEHPIIYTAPGISDLSNPSVIGEAKAKVILLPAAEANSISDSDYSKQWYLSAINAQSAWGAGYTGKNVKVLVLDPAGQFATAKQVADLSNAEFSGRVDANFIDTLNHSVHATNVAAVIGAGKNGINGVGVAYESILNSVSLPPQKTTSKEFRDSISLIQNYDVVNNSWNFTDAWDPKNTYNSIASAAIADAARYGRNGLGTIMVFAAGNDRSKAYDTSLHELNSNAYSITVGAINKVSDIVLNGQNTPFSTRGTSILVSAPGSNIVTTGVQLTTADGNTIGSNSTETQGTSVAAPIVSGVVALMLQANPNLNYRDVQTILALTARKDYSNTAQNDTAWFNNANFDWNGTGMHFSHDFGFGMVDAAAAVRMAETWLSVGADSVNTQTLATNSGQSIEDAGVAWLNFNVGATQAVEQAILNLTLTHAQWSDLRITLISPRGTASVLLDRAGVVGSQQFMNNPDGVTVFDKSLMSTHFRGESAVGTWQLKIEDLAANGKAASNIEASLNLISTVDRQFKRYTLTDEYTGGKVFGAVDLDSMGELNASAVSSNTMIDLDSHQGTFNGKTFTFGSGIDRLVGGGGNDVLTGSAQNETIFGGQGNDTIYGGAGHDRLEGGAGDDKLYGGEGQDILVGGLGNDRLTGEGGGDVFLIDGASGESTTTITDFDASQGDVVIIRTPAKLGFNAIQQSLNGSQLTLSYDIGNNAIRKVILQNVTSTLNTKQLKSYSKDQEVPIDPATGAATGNTVFVTPTWSVVKEDSIPIASYYAYNFYAADGFVPIGESDDYKVVHYTEYSATSKPGQRIIIGYGNVEPFVVNDRIFYGYPKSLVLPANVLSATWHDGKVILTEYSNNGFPTFKVADMKWSQGTNESEVLRLGNLSPEKPADISNADWQYALDHLGKPELSGLGGDDEIYGSNGAEILDGGTGNDTLYGGAGNDTISGGSDNDLIIGEAGNDLLIGGSGEDSFLFHVGDANDQVADYDQYSDTLLFQNISLSSLSTSLSFTDVSKEGLRVNTLLNYGSSSDSIQFSSRVNVGDFAFQVPVNHYRFKIDNSQAKVVALAASEISNKSDFVVQEKLSTKNVDLLSGNDAYYSLYTNQLNIKAGEGNDSLFVFSGGNTIHGDAGDDRIELQNSTSELTDYIYGDAGKDVIIGANVAAYIDGGADNDNITGSSKNDQLFGGDGDDSLYGGAGNDSLNGGIGTNRLFGGEGDDLLDGTISSLIAQSSSNYAAYLYGQQGNDTLNGSDQRDFLDGGADNDSLTGGAGDDVLLGGDGDDTLVGGAGDDLILSGSGADVIKLGLNSGRDFLDGLSAQDIIQIDGIAGTPDDFVLDKTNSFSKIQFSWRDNDSNLTNSLTLSNYNWGTTFKFVTSDGNLATKTLRQIFADNGYQVNDDFDYLDQYDTQLVGVPGTLGELVGSENDDQLFGGPISSSVTENSALNGVRYNDNASYWYVVGREGDDSIAAGFSGAIIDGGLGNDVIRGSNNVKVVSDTNFGGLDKLVLPEGITPEMLQYVRIQNPLEQAYIKLLKKDPKNFILPGSEAEITQSFNPSSLINLVGSIGQAWSGTRYLGSDKGTLTFNPPSAFGGDWVDSLGDPNLFFIPHFDTLRLQTVDGKFVIDLVGYYEQGKYKNNINELIFSSAFDAQGKPLTLNLQQVSNEKSKVKTYNIDGDDIFKWSYKNRSGEYDRVNFSITKTVFHQTYTKTEYLSDGSVRYTTYYNVYAQDDMADFNFDKDTSIQLGTTKDDLLRGTSSLYDNGVQIGLVSDQYRSSFGGTDTSSLGLGNQKVSDINDRYYKARNDILIGNEGDDTINAGGSFIQFYSTSVNVPFNKHNFGNFNFNFVNSTWVDENIGFFASKGNLKNYYADSSVNYLRFYSSYMFDTVNGGGGNDTYYYHLGDGILKIANIDVANGGADGWDKLRLLDFTKDEVIIRPIQWSGNNYRELSTLSIGELENLSWSGALEIIVPIGYEYTDGYKPIYFSDTGHRDYYQFGSLSNGRVYVEGGINGQYHVDEIQFKNGESINIHEWIQDYLAQRTEIHNISVYGTTYKNTQLSNTTYNANDYVDEYARKLNLAKSQLITGSPFSDLININQRGYYAGFEGADQYSFETEMAVVFWDKGDTLVDGSFQGIVSDLKFVGDILNQPILMGKSKSEWVASGVLPFYNNFPADSSRLGFETYLLGNGRDDEFPQRDPEHPIAEVSLGNYELNNDSQTVSASNWHSTDDIYEQANDVRITFYNYSENNKPVIYKQLFLIGAAGDIERRWFDSQSNKINPFMPYATEADDYISIFDTTQNPRERLNEIVTETVDGVSVDRDRVLYTLGGNDTVDAFASDTYDPTGDTYYGYRDKIYAGSGDDIVRSGAGNDTLYGGSGNDTLDGGYGDDLLVGGIGNDILIGGAGADVLNGGAGNDIYYADQSDIFFERPDAGDDTVMAEEDFRLDKAGAENIENLTLIGSGEFAGFGNSLNNIIKGNQANNVLNGLVGEDTLIGQGGDDTYYVDNERDVVIETADNGYDQINSSATYTLSANVEALLLTGIDNINGYGNSANNRVTGNDADNILDGGGGDDTLVGGYGNDTYIVDSLSDEIVERKYGGVDTVMSAISLTLGANLENLTLTGNNATDGTGNALDNVLVGNDANNVLNGKMGNDTLVGGLGSDTYIVGQLLDNWENYVGDTPEDTVIENASSNTDVDVLKIGVDSTNLSWVKFYRSIERSGDDLVLLSHKEYDTDMGGDDGKYKSIRIKNYFVGIEHQVEKIQFSDGLVKDIAQMLTEQGYQFNGTDQNDVMNGTDTARLIFGGKGNDTINGGAGANSIYGGEGDDTLSGGRGNDTLSGGAGSDTYVFSRGDGVDLIEDSSYLEIGGWSFEDNTIRVNANSSEVNLTRTGYVNPWDTKPPQSSNLIIEFKNSDTDRLTFRDWWSAGSSNDNRRVVFNDKTISLDGIELALTVKPTTSGADFTYGSGRNDTLSGGNGNDFLIGLGGADSLSGDAGNDILYGGIDNDTLYGGIGHDKLYGEDGQDSLYGGDGNDTLDGGLGSDYLNGGAGWNTYYVDDIGDTVIGNGDLYSDLQIYTLANGQNLNIYINKGLNAIGNAENNVITGNADANFIIGNAGDDRLDGGIAGTDILQGGEGMDTVISNSSLWDSNALGNALLDGGANNDTLYSSYVGPVNRSSSDVLIGGKGDDIIFAGTHQEAWQTDDGYEVPESYGPTGNDVILFNVGDGQDTLYAGEGPKLTLSLGKLSSYDQLSFTKSGNNLVLNVGTSDKIMFSDWYANKSFANTKSIATLQVIADSLNGFSTDSTNKLRNNTIETFNFANVVADFDAAGAQSNWQLSEDRLSKHLQSGSNTEAIGGDIAYQYGHYGNLTGMGLNSTQAVLSDANFGNVAQTFSTSTIGANEAIRLS